MTAAGRGLRARPVDADEAGPPRPLITIAAGEAALFASDMHLGEHDLRTAQYFLEALERETATITHLFLLGDLFEVWVGDDQQDAIAAGLIEALARLRARGVWVGVMVGNRDFLLDVPIPGVTAFSGRSGAEMLDDPVLVELFGIRTLVAHGDAWCVSDSDYQRFRAEVRTAAWQGAFLERTLADRLALARALRSESERRRAITDIDRELVAGVMRLCGAARLIHGHTHLPGDSWLDGESPHGLQRHVLSDWSAADRRGEFLRVDRKGWQRLPA